MLERDILNVFERKGIDKEGINLPIIKKILFNYNAFHRTVSVENLIRMHEKSIFSIGDTTIKILEDGTLRIQAKGSQEYCLTDKIGIEVEKVLEVTDEGEKKLVRRNGTIREVLVTDQGEKYTSEEVFLDNGDPEIQAAIGARISDKQGKPIYFNPEEAFKTFDENMISLKNGSLEQQRYYREARKKLEETIQDEKLFRLPLEKKIKALKELEEDLSFEYNGLCDFIALELEAHRNDLSLIRKIQMLPDTAARLEKELVEYKKRIEKFRISPEGHDDSPKNQADSASENNNAFSYDKLLSEEDALVRSIYTYRKRNAELRTKLDTTTDITNAFSCVYESIKSPHFKKGIVLKFFLMKYDSEHQRLLAEKANKRKEYDNSKAAIQKQRQDRKENEEFNKKRQKEKYRLQVSVSPTPTISSERKDKEERRSYYSPAGKM